MSENLLESWEQVWSTTPLVELMEALFEGVPQPTHEKFSMQPIGAWLGLEEDKALEYLSEKDGNHPEMLYKAGLCLELGVCTDRDIDQAAQLYKKAVDLGNLGAHCQLGLCYQNGAGVEENLSKAWRLYQVAADEGCARAHAMQAYWYIYGLPEVSIPVDHVRGIALARHAAARGDLDGQWLLGCCHRNGWGTPKKNIDKGLFFYRQCAKRGHAGALKYLAICYMQDDYGVKRDMAEALVLLRMAASQGNIESLGLISHFFTHGHVVEKDEGMGIVLCKIMRTLAPEAEDEDEIEERGAPEPASYDDVGDFIEESWMWNCAVM